MTKLFVVGFPREMDEMSLAQLFGPHGDIDILTIVRDKFTKQSKGFGFIHMKDAEGAQMAIEALDGKEFGDRKLEVRIAEEKPAPVNGNRAPQKRFPPRTNNSGYGGGSSYGNKSYGSGDGNSRNYGSGNSYNRNNDNRSSSSDFKPKRPRLSK
ncbi:hypothetical protein FPZ42_16060 [Mucilaginibacter achroorhodeus]|uniref:RRM domain-containing protein n=1 Tax=Mucilaginibacter achroorhodeus TaxID=2599294 RepID=A0A563TZQ8_9SPHI|nr:hypothetical protein [Mucilaginibacter achroorhodeus]TWR24610.1 hypothetical protein FPZ42_16060 [Mucilaginibacter achroorhodeus]